MDINAPPQSGDVLFLSSSDISTLVSRIAQTMLDPDAEGAIHTFGHVAIAISDLLALEAVPANPQEINDRAATLKHTVAFGEWTNSELRGGVRLIPIADLVVPAMKAGDELVVLRTSEKDEVALSRFTPYNSDVLRMLGSQYSIDMLRESAAERAPNGLKNVFNAKFNWTSVPTDLATLIDIDPQLRKSIAARMPDYSLPDVARTYFCSQAVVKCLKVAGLLPNDVATDLTTPTGLHRLLVDRNWLDVSTAYRCPADVDRYLHQTPLAHSASYTSTLALVGLAIQQDVHNLEIEFIDSSLKAMHRLCDNIMKKLP